MENIAPNFTSAYLAMMRHVYETPDFVCAPRGQKIKEILGYKFVIKNPRDRLPFVAGRKFQPTYYAAESIWYFSGLSSTKWISNYSKFWEKISDDDENANSAYGSRIFKPHDRIGSMIQSDWTQWDYVIRELCNDSDSRRAVIHLRTAQDSILAKKDVPCTNVLQFMLRDNKLYMFVNMRSSDVVFGIGNDIPAFTLFQEAMALELSNALDCKIELGDYIHTSHSLHIYEKDFEMVEKILNSIENVPACQHEMPAMPFFPPTETLLAFEKECTDAQSIDDIWHLLGRTAVHPYYKDWCYLLAAHRAGKLGNKDYKTQLLLATSYEGYRWFAK